MSEEPEKTSNEQPQIGDRPKTGDRSQRRPIFESASAAVEYVDQIRKAKKVVSVRDFDRQTNILLGSALLFIVVPLLAPVFPVTVLWVGDAIFGLILLIFVVSRLGLISTLTPKQALIIWEIILGSTIFGAFIALNLQGLISLIRAGMLGKELFH